MPETVLKEPLPLIWMGTIEDVTDVGEWQRGWAFSCPPDVYPVYRDLNPALAGRDPIVIMCPMGENRAVDFCIDALSTVKNEPWEVEVDMASLVIGQKPRITVKPSIHIVGIWHGFCTEGVLAG